MSKPFDKIYVIDFETRWSSKEYTLSKMTTEEYIRDPRFKAFGMCIKEYGDGLPATWVRSKDLQEWVDSIDWSRAAVLAHNAQFDVAILSWVYGVVPAFIFDSLSMARALRGVEVGNSLAKLAEEFGLPPKGRAVHSTDGLVEIPFAVEEELAEYCRHDTFLCEEVFKRLVEGYPQKELRLIDLTLKMFTSPVLELDQTMLEEAIHEEREKREGLLARLGVTDGMLASNDQFADLLVTMGCEPPLKKSKTTGKETYALAKNDALFQALLNSEREEVSLLCEARLKVKSTLERTRAQRFLEIAQRGTLPVPLNYYGAHTGRWAASRGSGINMQNMKRGSFLRKSILAPDGYQLVVCDLAQIEPRVLAWLAGYEDVLEIFKSGGDPYALFARDMFSIPDLTKESHPDLRQSAKSAMLGCFGADTPVLTQRGWLPIVQVQATDTVWDGEEWVCHQGVVPQGEKEVLTARGISATSDHEILTERGWVGWSAVLANPSRFQSALSLASLPVSAGTARQLVDSILLCSAPAGGRGLSIVQTLLQGALHAAMPALKERLSKLDGNEKGTSLYALIDGIVSDCWTALVPSSSDAQTRTVPCTPTMEGVELQFTQSGLRTALRSYATSFGLMDGMPPRCSLTASTTTAGTSPATYGLSHEAPICLTNDASLHERSKCLNNVSPPLKQRMQTYDLAYAGPRNRYTILTSEGPLIVHNCGYGLGWASFAAQLLTGFLGAPPMRYDKRIAKMLGVTPEKVQKFVSWDVNLEKMATIPHTCTQEELLIHCLAAKEIIDKYRAAAQPVVDYWGMCQDLIPRSLQEGREYAHKCVTFKKGEVLLPSGLSLRYPDLRGEADSKGRVQWSYGEHFKKLYGGKMTENIVQSVARCVMTDGMLRIQKRYPCVLTVHDEVVVLIPENEVSEGEAWVLEQMIKEPSYMPGIPLGAETGAAKRYGDAK